MSYLRRNMEFVVSSDPNNGAVNTSSDGSTFYVQLEEPIDIPNEAENVTCEVETAEIWWTVPNIIVGQNDQFRLVDTNAGATPSGTAFAGTITIPQGLYDLTQLANRIETELVNAGAAQNTISFLADDSTQKVIIQFNFTGVSVDFTIANTCRDLLGWTSVVVGPYVAAPTYATAPLVAQFNLVTYFLLHGDIVDRGVPFNNRYSQVLAQVYIDVAPGSQILYRPFHAAMVDASHLRGAKRNYFRYWLTDQNLNLVNTNSEYWSARVVIKYDIKR